MQKKLTDVEKLKYWMDAEFSILHIMFAVIMLELTEGWFPTIAFSLYILYAIIYGLVRIAYIAADDPDYLKVPKK